MKTVFTVTDRDPYYLLMAKVFVLTARKNSNAELCCIYDGQQGEFTSWLARHEVRCIQWQVPFINDICKKYTGKKSVDYCAGAYLCVEIPNAFRANGIDDTHVLYMDVDTIVLNDLCIDDRRPKYLAATPDWDISDWGFFGAGVMLINLEQVRCDYNRFVEHLYRHNFDFAFVGHGPCNQGAWNTFYKDKWERLSPEYDWKPWWGVNPLAKLVHFSGPKPFEIAALLTNNEEEPETERQKINKFVVQKAPNAFRSYLGMWNAVAKDVSDEKEGGSL